jgi:hypothetical protein
MTSPDLHFSTTIHLHFSTTIDIPFRFSPGPRSWGAGLPHTTGLPVCEFPAPPLPVVPTGDKDRRYPSPRLTVPSAWPPQRQPSTAECATSSLSLSVL